MCHIQLIISLRAADLNGHRLQKPQTPGRQVNHKGSAELSGELIVGFCKEFIGAPSAKPYLVRVRRHLASDIKKNLSIHGATINIWILEFLSPKVFGTNPDCNRTKSAHQSPQYDGQQKKMTCPPLGLFSKGKFREIRFLQGV